MIKLSPYLYENLWLKYAYRNYRKTPLQILEFLNKTQYWKRSQIENYQIDKLKILFNIAANSSGYYKRVFKDFEIDKLILEDIKKLPLLSKETVQQNYSDFITSDTNKNFLRKTSGSTGIPLQVYLPQIASAYRVASHYRFHSWWGIRPGDRNALIWGRKATIPKNGLLKIMKNHVVDRTYFINSFNLNKKNAKQYFIEMVKFKPVYFRGYVSAIREFGELVVELKLDVSKLPLKLIIVTAEVLYPYDREFIENTFNCKVANEYGASDGGLFAYECPKGGIHLQEDLMHCWANNESEFIVTELHNYLMPLINYKMDDKVVFSEKKCSCERNLRLIKSIKGRLGDTVIKPDGTSLDNHIFTYLFKELSDIGFDNCVRKWKIVQNNLNFNAFIVKGLKFNEQVQEYIIKYMKEKIGESININFHFVNEIKKEKSGKLRYFVRENFD